MARGYILLSLFIISKHRNRSSNSIIWLLFLMHIIIVITKSRIMFLTLCPSTRRRWSKYQPMPCHLVIMSASSLRDTLPALDTLQVLDTLLALDTLPVLFTVLKCSFPLCDVFCDHIYDYILILLSQLAERDLNWLSALGSC